MALRLKANKTSLYKLVAEFETLPPRVRTRFIKSYRAPDYALEWTTRDCNRARAFFAGCMGRPMLSIEIRDFDNHTVSRVVHGLDLADLQARGMVEEYTAAAERRRLEREAAQ